MKMRTIRVVDLYCGGGGFTTGLYRAADRLNLRVELTGINHWDKAIETHTANHPNARHLCTSVNMVDPRDVVPGGHLHLLIAAPECIHFSVARGGKPVNPQSRASAWHVLHWLETIRVDSLVLENVKEFRGWGPLKRVLRPNKKTGKMQRVWIPDPKRKGETFHAFLAALRSLNYTVEHRVINAADFGDPTTRERFFLIAKRADRKVRWPEPTHTSSDNKRLFGAERRKWEPASVCIDWKIPGRSIFKRKKPLAPATLERILTGLERFGGQQLQPFLVILRNHGRAQSIDGPIPTLCASGNHVAVAQPFITAFRGSHAGKNDGSTRNHPIDEPLRTMDTSPRFGVVEPFILAHRQFDEACVDSIERPFRTLTAKGAGDVAIVEPFIVPQFSSNAPKSINEPVGTITSTSRGMGLAQSFITKVTHTKSTSPPVRSTDDPLSTVTTAKGGEHALVQPFLVQLTHGGRVKDVNDPLPTVTGAHRGETAVINPLIAKYYGTGQCRPVDEPLDTISTKDRFGLVMPVVNGYALDIRFRMLQPKELAAAMGFPANYKFSGNREAVVKQIGNAVAVNTATALCEAVLQ